MFYIFAALLIAIGLGGLIITLQRQQRRNKFFYLLDASKQFQQSAGEQDDTSQMERILKRTSRLVSLSAMLDKNIVAKAITVVVLAAIVFFIDASGFYKLEAEIMALLMIAIILLIILLPNAIKNVTIKKRMKNIANDFPFIIDMMAVCVQSGMTVEKSLRYIADNTHNINQDIAVLFDRTMLKAEVSGISLALEQLYQEVSSNEVRMFCSTLQQSIKFGSSVYQVLLDLSKEMRTVQILSMEEKVASLSAKMTLPMIAFIMFPLLVIVAGPGLIGMVSTWSK